MFNSVEIAKKSMRRSHWAACYLIVTAIALSSFSVKAELNSSFYFGLDNDGVFGVDQDYTNGIFLSFSTDFDLSDQSLTTALPFNHFDPHNQDRIYKWGMQAGQKMWTPSDIEVADPQPGERPYAGLLFADINMYALDSEDVYRYAFMLGTTGDNALTEKSQKFVHSITKSGDPIGWHNQIEDKIVFNFSYSHSNKLHTSETESANSHEFLSTNRMMLGTFRSELALGTMWRYGTHLNDSFGSANITNEASIDPAMIRRSKTGWFVFSGIEGRFRYNDITIDGDRPDTTYPTTVEHWQATAAAGAVGYYRGWGVSFTVAAKTKDFVEDNSDILANGSLALFWLF